MIDLKYRAHATDKGWLPEVKNLEIAGTTGEGRPIEAVQIVGLDIPGLGIQGFAHVSGLGWSQGNNQGEHIGTTGKGLPVEAFMFNLFGEKAGDYQLWYRVHVANKGFMNWVRAGYSGNLNATEYAGTIGGGNAVEAIQMGLFKSDEQVWLNSDTTATFEDLTPPPAPPQPARNPNERGTIIAIAQSQVGFERGSDYTTPYGSYLGQPDAEYCAAFVAWCAGQAGLADKYPQDAYVPNCVQYYMNRGQFIDASSGYVPQTGDQVFFDFTGNRQGSHTGIVESANDWIVNVIEGNSGIEPNGVWRRSWGLDDSLIWGYGVPDIT